MNRPFPRLICLSASLLFFVLGCSREDTVQDAEDYLKRAEVYRDQGQYRAALIEITNAMNSAPENPAYPVAMAELYLTLGASKRASDLLEPYLSEHRSAIVLPLTHAYLEQEKFLSAEETLESYTPETDAERRKMALKRAHIQRLRGDLKASEEAYQAILEQKPEHLDASLGLAETLLLQEGRGAEAKEILAHMRQLYPESSQPFYLSALLATRQKEFDQAEKFLTEALLQAPKADVMLPERATILQALADILSTQGRMTEALIYNKVLREESPDAIEAQRRLKDATLALEKGDYDEAEALLQAMIGEDPDSQSAALLLGMVNFSQGKVGDAEALLTRSVDVETAAPDVIQATVMAQAQSGQLTEALATLERSLRAHPDEPLLLSLYGVLALNNPDTEQDGYLSLQKALARDPHRGTVRLALVRYHDERDEPEQAMAQLRAAFGYQPADWPVTSVYLNRLLLEDNLEESEEALKTLRQAAPKARETKLYEARHQYVAGSKKGALKQLEDLLDQEPDFVQGHGVLIGMYRDSGEPQKALDTAETLASLEPENPQALRAGLEILREEGRYDEAQAWLRGLAKRNASLRSNVEAMRALLYRGSGDYGKALKTIEAVRHQERPLVRQVKTLLYKDQATRFASQEEYDQARALLAEALELQPDNKSLNIDLIKLDLAQGRYQQADLLLSNLEDSDPENAELAVLRARWIQDQHGPEQAYESLSQRWDEQPDGDFAVHLIALAREVAPEEVDSIMRHWEQIDPVGRGRLLYVADRYQRAGDEASAIDTYQTLLEKNREDSIALNNLAWLLKDRDLERAIELAAQAVALEPDSPAILDTYGWLLHMDGEKEKAIEYLQRAVDLAPGAPELKEHLEAVKSS